MQVDGRSTLVVGGADKLKDLPLVGMDAAGGEQAEHMQGAAGFPQPIDECAEVGVAFEFAALHGLVDARQVLVHDPPGPDDHVSDFGVAHLACGEPDIHPRTGKQGVRAAGQEAIPIRRVRRGDGVVRRRLPMAEAVENDEDQFGGWVVNCGFHKQAA